MLIFGWKVSKLISTFTRPRNSWRRDTQYNNGCFNANLSVPFYFSNKRMKTVTMFLISVHVFSVVQAFLKKR